MTKYNSIEFKTVRKTVKSGERRSWIHFSRQLFVCSGAWVIYFVLGLCFGAPTVFIPQIRKEANSSEIISIDMESWLTSVHGYSALPFVFIIPIVTQFIGRKIPFIIVTAITILAFTVFYCSTTTTHLLISEIMQGMLLASNMTLLIVIVTEYTSPRYRSIFMAIESSVFFWGVWVANAVGTFFHWKNIGIIAFVGCVYCLSAICWPESPSWLALKGRFEECAAAHHWLKGYDAESVKELESLLNSQKEYHYLCERRRITGKKDRLGRALEVLTTKGFYKPLLLAFTVLSLYHFSGKFVCTMYAVQVISEITENELMAYIGMLILEGVTVFGMQIGCILSQYLKRRTLLLFFSAVGISFLYLISLYLYLINLGVLNDNKYVSLLLMMLFSLSISIGPMIVPFTLFAEIIFLRYKSASLLMITLYSELTMATILKVSPHVFKVFTLHGAFFLYAVSASVFTILLYKYLPETKDKSLQEIEEYFIERPKSDKVGKDLIE